MIFPDVFAIYRVKRKVMCRINFFPPNTMFVAFFLETKWMG